MLHFSRVQVRQEHTYRRDRLLNIAINMGGYNKREIEAPTKPPQHNSYRVDQSLHQSNFLYDKLADSALDLSIYTV